jgi:hypothetical protein
MTINDYDVITFHCDLRAPHKAHTERYGFLWLRKSKCPGMSEIAWNKWLDSKWSKPKPPHKHRFEYRPTQTNIWLNPDRYVWICKDKGCDQVVSTVKEELRGVLLYDGPTKLQKRPDRRSPWRSS